MRWDRGSLHAKCPRCRGRLAEDGRCPRGHGAFVPQGAAEAGPPEPRRYTGDEPFCPGCGAPMDVVLEVAGDVLASSCGRCRGLWLAVADVGSLHALLRE